MTAIGWGNLAEYTIQLLEFFFAFSAEVLRYCMQMSGITVAGEFYGSFTGAMILTIIATIIITPVFVLGIQQIIKKLIYGGLNGSLLFNR